MIILRYHNPIIEPHYCRIHFKYNFKFKIALYWKF